MNKWIITYESHGNSITTIVKADTIFEAIRDFEHYFSDRNSITNLQVKQVQFEIDGTGKRYIG